MCLRFGIVLVLFTTKVITEKCTTPNNEVADCVSLYSCSVLTSALATHQNSSIEFVRKSNCGGTTVDPLVCCGSSSSFITRNTEKKTQNTSRRSLLPERSYCGYQHTDDYVAIRNGTAINEFPWLAGLVAEDDEKMQSIICGGSLISNRYVLTAANCVIRNAYRNLTIVRLGEYNVKTEKDCVEEDADLIECSEIQDYGIEQRIVHSEYNGQRHLNDIALLRLNRTVTYSDYIRPICLPAPGIKSAETGDELISSGWGRTHFTGGSMADVKKKVLTKLITNDECKAASRQYRDVLTENHFCTLELDSGTEISCQGDGGGPIMFSHRNQWQQEGISSFGISCHAGIPDVHVKVANYLDWIKSNIKA